MTCYLVRMLYSGIYSFTLLATHQLTKMVGRFRVRVNFSLQGQVGLGLGPRVCRV